MTPPAARGRCQGGSIACSDCGDHIYQCAKFGACFQKCTNIVLSHWTIIRSLPLSDVTNVIITGLSWLSTFPVLGSCLGNVSSGKAMNRASTPHSRNPIHHAPTQLLSASVRSGGACPGCTKICSNPAPTRNPNAGPRADIEYMIPVEKKEKWFTRLSCMKARCATNFNFHRV